MNRERYDIQGRLFGMPYDFRIPTVGKWLRRHYLPGGPALAPKVFGWGWTLNFAHPQVRSFTKVLLLVALVAATIA